jgi:uncharacterized protein with HEPN domain
MRPERLYLFSVDWSIVWVIAVDDVPTLRRQVAELLTERAEDD